MIENILYEGGADWGQTPYVEQSTSTVSPMPDVSVESEAVKQVQNLVAGVQYHKPDVSMEEAMDITKNAYTRISKEFGVEQAAQIMGKLLSPDRSPIDPNDVTDIDMNTQIEQENLMKGKLREEMLDARYYDVPDLEVGDMLSDEGVDGLPMEGAIDRNQVPKEKGGTPSETKVYNVEPKLMEHIIQEENPRGVGYDPTNNSWTPYKFSKVKNGRTIWEVDVGYGHYLGDYATEEEADKVITNSKKYSSEEVTSLAEKHLHNSKIKLKKEFSEDVLKAMPKEIEEGLLAMMYQIGDTKVLTKFKKMKAAIKQKDWAEVIVQAQDSLWYKQTTKRANRVLSNMAKGI